MAERKLEAPHRRLEPGSRTFERTVVLGYRAAAWIVGHVPPAIPRALIGRAAQLSYLLWPSKRRWSNANFAHVLGLPPGDARVRRTALAAYGEYARYVVEMMRLPRLKPELAAHLLPDVDLDEVEQIWRSSEGGLIFVFGHVGNPEACGAAIASRGWPTSVLADDSAFPEMFEEFRRSREQWGATVIPWRNLREIYGVLRRREMLALLIDWGYRPDGIPVRLFDSWTSLPAGPATLAAKTKSRILPVAIRRQRDGTFHAALSTPIEVPSAAPADLLRATQQMADALGNAIGAAPEQWYSFKPMWPSDPAETVALEERAAQMASQVGEPRVVAGPRVAAEFPSEPAPA